MGAWLSSCGGTLDDSDDEDEEEKPIDIRKLTYEQRQQVANEELARRMKETDSQIGKALELVQGCSTHNQGSLERLRALKFKVLRKKGKGEQAGPAHFSMKEMMEMEKALVGIENRLNFVVEKMRDAEVAVETDANQQVTSERRLHMGLEELTELLKVFKDFNVEAEKDDKEKNANDYAPMDSFNKFMDVIGDGDDQSESDSGEIRKSGEQKKTRRESEISRKDKSKKGNSKPKKSKTIVKQN
mmetsp:Transcript_28704/g.39664  ORF Transcript_28704/g.39664 Transcript_28704/m.39664 type:complete len:243 (+) Transcript_28704:137-865(+)|eukprot:CAMPEP_0196594526 /NCGR_PEP_ID=MMETSP1081-20130531/78619_1 /TAXON_ID=36882 /ORGANISM="Pyramimonas amylifera, Strain CCMP720" /LENGTH=242 /DNA_ID=CAMNT_0041918817 /DNA_START=133 /DNA_END=861 /DNA_ORIENTATION=-